MRHGRGEAEASGQSHGGHAAGVSDYSVCTHVSVGGWGRRQEPLSKEN